MIIIFSLFLFFQFPFQFEELSGNNDITIWQNIKTEEDFENLDFFKTSFEKSLGKKNLRETIPQLIHFIWLSEERPSKKIMGNLKSWYKHHPGWTIKCWNYGNTFVCPFPIEWTQVQSRKHSLKRAEAAELMRYQILSQEGGIVIDPSMECLQSLEFLARDFNFFAGMNLPEEGVLSSSIFPSSSVIGAIKGHPVIEETLYLLENDWEKIDLYFPVKNEKSLKYRLNFRFTNAFQQAIRTNLNKKGYRDIVLPPAFFSSLGTHMNKIFSLQTWIRADCGMYPLAKKTVSSHLLTDKNSQEVEAERFIDQMKKKINKILVVDSILCLINLCLGFMFISRRIGS